jgi:putative alpha-1,2-mannosidase
MSAWYIMSALGFYPIAGGDEYWLGRPIFTRALIAREAGDIEIRAAGAENAETVFATAKIAGQKVTGRFNHALIARGAKIEFLP